MKITYSTYCAPTLTYHSLETECCFLQTSRVGVEADQWVSMFGDDPTDPTSGDLIAE